MIKLKDIKKLSPVRIKYENIYGARGYYQGHWNKDKIPKIDIKKNLTRKETIICLLHEIGHAVCDKNKCKCQYPHKKPPSFLSEYHAIKFSLDFLTKHPDKNLIKCFDEELEGIKHHKVYDKVVEKIKKLKRYKSLINNHLGKP